MHHIAVRRRREAGDGREEVPSLPSGDAACFQTLLTRSESIGVASAAAPEELLALVARDIVVEPGGE